MDQRSGGLQWGGRRLDQGYYAKGSGREPFSVVLAPDTARTMVRINYSVSVDGRRPSPTWVSLRSLTVPVPDSAAMGINTLTLLDRHFLSDIVVGAAVGITCVWLVTRWLGRRTGWKTMKA